MKVLKFGGTSVANAENIGNVLQIIKDKPQKMAVVVSAFGGITDALLLTGKTAAAKNLSYQESFADIENRHLDAVRQLIPVTAQSGVISNVKKELNQLETLFEGAYLLGELSPRTSDIVASYGELLSSYIIAEAAKHAGIDVCHKDARQLIQTSDHFGKASVNFEVTNKKCQDFFDGNKHQITIVPGFVASTEKGETTTLGRGGSDYSAAIIAAAINATDIEIWTDVSGMYTANPRLVKQAFPIEHISYQEAMELSHFGAKVIYPPTIQPILEKEIPIWVKNTFDPKSEGTYITKNTNGKGKPVKGISHVERIALITLEGSGMVGIPGFSKRLFEVLFQEGINIILITQASSEHSICLAIDESEAERAKQAIDKAFEYEIQLGKVEPTILEKGQAIIALVGDNMKSHQGLSGRMFSALGKNNVNIRAIAQGASEKNISAVISKADVKKALNTLHERFFEDNIKQLNLFVTGVGNVGERFLNQVRQQHTYLKEKLKLNVRVIGLSNSRTMVFDENGIDLSQWESKLAAGEQASLEGFFEQAKQFNLRNSIFVDNTASAHVSDRYAEYLRNSIAIVTCNKIACSSAFDQYQELKDLSRKYNAPFLFETNVGAGLPIIDTLKNLIASGDNVRTIQAVLSGSLNFVFNNFKEGVSFHDIVKQAQEEGYTEPDPKIDLSGVDVARKILILARESKNRLDLEDIENKSFLPEESLVTTNNDDFFASLKTYEKDFDALYAEAAAKGCRLKYVAQYEDGKASVGLQHIPEGHDFYNLEGSDNIVLFFTDRYPKQPLIVKGAGAGADVTASGIFADVIRIGKV